jgi:hypothetical protein
VRELVAAEVYPTLILLAARLLEVLGATDPVVHEAAENARAALDGDFSVVTADWVTELLGLDPPALYRTALDTPEAAAGFYNRNVRVGRLLVRAPIDGADGMDLRIWVENEVLASLGPHVRCAPRLRFASAAPSFQVHDFVDGTLLDELAPRGVRVPEDASTPLEEDSDHIPSPILTLSHSESRSGCDNVKIGEILTRWSGRSGRRP